MGNILALDDVLDAANLVKRILETKGHTVFPFTEEEALLFAESNAMDLAILDIKLKKMSGVEVLEELKKRSPSIRVIMLTGYPTIETARAECLPARTCLYPFDTSLSFPAHGQPRRRMFLFL